MEQEVLQRLERLEQKLDRTTTSVEKTRKYMLWSLVVTVGMIIVPILLLLFFLPMLLDGFSGGLESQLTELEIEL